MISDVTLTEAANHCRSPDGDTQGIWCYTTDPDVVWGYCDAPYCRKYGIDYNMNATQRQSKGWGVVGRVREGWGGVGKV